LWKLAQIEGMSHPALMGQELLKFLLRAAEEGDWKSPFHHDPCSTKDISSDGRQRTKRTLNYSSYSILTGYLKE